MRLLWLAAGLAAMLLLVGCTFRSGSEISADFQMSFSTLGPDGSSVPLDLTKKIPVGTEFVAIPIWINTGGGDLPPAPDTSGSFACPNEVVVQTELLQSGFALKVEKSGVETLQFIFSSYSLNKSWYHEYTLITE